MVPLPPPSLHVEATAAETRILLDHGRPAPPIARWKRLAVAVWLLAFVLGWFLPFLFCPASITATLGLVLAFVVDARRTVVERVVLTPEACRIVSRGVLGLQTRQVPWGRVQDVVLESDLAGPRARDALLVRVGEPEAEATEDLRVGLGRPVEDLRWIRTCLLTIRERVVGSARREAPPT